MLFVVKRCSTLLGKRGRVYSFEASVGGFCVLLGQGTIRAEALPACLLACPVSGVVGRPDWFLEVT